MKKLVFLFLLLALMSCSKEKTQQVEPKNNQTTKTQNLENVENELSKDLDKLLELPAEK